MSDAVNIDIGAIEAARLLLKAQRLVLTTHAKPDGDAFGSLIALTLTLQRMGKDVQSVAIPPIPAPLQGMAGAEVVQVFDARALWRDADCYVILDTAAWSQLPGWRTVLEPVLDHTLVIDHHLMGDVPAKWKRVDTQAAACCEVLMDVLVALHGRADAHRELDLDVAEALFVGITSDTGWFRFSNTRPQTHRLAAALLEKGVDHASIFGRLEQKERPEKLRLMIRALDSLELLADQRAALMVLTPQDFAETGAAIDETERFVDLPQMVQTVELVALVVAPPGEASQPVRISFRSKPGPRAVNVAELAQQFQGGGHARAAGAKVQGDLPVVVNRVRIAIEAALRDR